MSNNIILLTIFVPGEPKPQGSKDQFGRESCKLLPAWRNLISILAKQEMAEMPPLDEALEVAITFIFPRPKNHFGTGKKADEPKDSAPTYKISRPDVDKLIRAVLDAGTGIIWVDDSNVVSVQADKRYDSPPGAIIMVRRLTE